MYQEDKFVLPLALSVWLNRTIFNNGKNVLLATFILFSCRTFSYSGLVWSIITVNRTKFTKTISLFYSLLSLFYSIEQSLLAEKIGLLAPLNLFSYRTFSYSGLVWSIITFNRTKYTKTISLFYSWLSSFYWIEQSQWKKFVLLATFNFSHIEHSLTLDKFDISLQLIEQSVPRG